MSMKFRASTASLGVLACLRWIGVSVVSANDKYHQIAAPSFVVDQITTVMGGGPSGLSKITLRCVGGAQGPAWLQPGIGVAINVTVESKTYDFAVVVADVADDGKSFTVNPSGRAGAAISKVYTNQGLDAVAAGIVNTVTLNMQCQKAMISVMGTEANNIDLAPSAVADGTSVPYFVALTPGGVEYEVTAPTGAKFDLTDLWIKSEGGAPNLSIRFL